MVHSAKYRPRCHRSREAYLTGAAGDVFNLFTDSFFPSAWIQSLLLLSLFDQALKSTIVTVNNEGRSDPNFGVSAVLKVCHDR